MWQLTIVYRVQAEDGEWLTGLYRNLFASYTEAYHAYMDAADPDDSDWDILEWDIT